MGMIAYILAVTPGQIAEIRETPSQAGAIVEFGLKHGAAVDLDKSWHGLHYLLAGSLGPEASPLSWAIMGGTEIGDDLGYGPPRLLDVAEVAAVATAIASVTESEMRVRYSPEDMEEGVYPSIWIREGDAGLDWLLSRYPTLKQFYVEASSNGNGALLWIS